MRKITEVIICDNCLKEIDLGRVKCVNYDTGKRDFCCEMCRIKWEEKYWI